MPSRKNSARKKRSQKCSRKKNGKRSCKKKSKSKKRSYRFAPKMEVGMFTKYFNKKEDLFPVFVGDIKNKSDDVTGWVSYYDEPKDMCKWRLDKSDRVYSKYNLYRDLDENKDGKKSNLYLISYYNKKGIEAGHLNKKEQDAWGYQVVAKTRKEAEDLINDFEKNSPKFPKDFYSTSVKREDQVNQREFSGYVLEKEYPSKIIEFSHSLPYIDAFQNVWEARREHARDIYNNSRPPEMPNRRVYNIKRYFLEDFTL